MNLPRHLTCLLFTLLLVMAICGAQGRVWRIRHTCIAHIKKSKTRSKEKNKSYNQIKMCTCMDYGGWNGNSFLYDLSLYKFFWDHGYLFVSFFSWTFMCPYIFFLFFQYLELHVSIYFFLFFQYLDLHVSIYFFSIAHASLFFNKNWRERDQHILWSFYFVEWMDGTMLTSHRSIARGMLCARESWSWKHEKNSLKGHNNLTKLNAKTSSICVHGFQGVSSYVFGRTLAYQRGASQWVFPNFQINFPST